MSASHKLRTVSVLAAALLLFALLSGCGDSVKDVPASDIAAAVDAAISVSGSMVDADAYYVEGLMKLSASDYSECAVKVNASTAFDEYGIFKAKDSSQAKTVSDALKTYIDMRISTDMGYEPEELPKLQNAEVKTKGNYIMYAVLGDADKSAAFSAFENALK